MHICWPFAGTTAPRHTRLSQACCSMPSRAAASLDNQGDFKVVAFTPGVDLDTWQSVVQVPSYLLGPNTASTASGSMYI